MWNTRKESTAPFPRTERSVIISERNATDTEEGEVSGTIMEVVVVPISGSVVTTAAVVMINAEITTAEAVAEESIADVVMVVVEVATLGAVEVAAVKGYEDRQLCVASGK